MQNRELWSTGEETGPLDPAVGICRRYQNIQNIQNIQNQQLRSPPLGHQMEPLLSTLTTRGEEAPLSPLLE